jgi:DNA mismatch repair protein MutS
VLAALAAGERAGALAGLADDLPLFRAAPAPVRAQPSAVDTLLADVRPDELSPKEALELVYRLIAARGEGSS